MAGIGRKYRFDKAVESKGWAFAEGDIVTFVDTIADRDWFAHLVQTDAGAYRRIGAGILDRYASEVTE